MLNSLKLGIIAGGQLAKMLVQEASKWDIVTFVLDNEQNCPASGVASVFIQGDHRDYAAVYDFGKQVDLLTFEIESVNIGALLKLKSEGVQIVPDPSVLEIIQDKGTQKQFFADHEIITSPFQLCKSKAEIIEAIACNRIRYPFVQKARKGGYDGRGVVIINAENELKDIMDCDSVIESKIDVSKEISVIAARNRQGEIRCFPAVELIIEQEANLVEKLLCPARFSPTLAKKAESIALEVIKKLNMEGLLAVELFIDQHDDIYVNEVSPRPHNSGHHTIESVATSQFEQHLRAIFNLPLGSTSVIMPSVMLNLLGEKGFTGPVVYRGIAESLAIEGVKIHLYGKQITSYNRKMGHVTILSTSLEDALQKALTVKKLIKVQS
ncbi:MAG: 5-(carboxyamino)imidazole ribonucleotide synthase [Candidatus Cloacimonadaceae bacterium]|nr:5-(carboxyamino)imidazole ribonucleotide synthase [Candidatus Cloacimonadaceae bacterium]